MHHIFINENCIENNLVILSKGMEEYNHLVKSLRIGVGEKVLCSVIPFNFSFDYRCKVSEINEDKLIFEIEEKLKSNELPVKINLYQGITKSDKFEYIIEKAVELGVYSITPLSTDFCVAKIEGKKIESKLERYNKIAKSAAEQSKRNIIPEVKVPICFDDLPENNTILFYENADGIETTRNLIRNMVEGCKKTKNADNNIQINVVIGPEGGFADKEIEKAKTKGIHIMSLGDRILRTETAAFAALSILMYEFEK